ncbi:MAG: hypothetical protein WCO60_17280 [Verrucomicrobiota bacterium]
MASVRAAPESSLVSCIIALLLAMIFGYGIKISGQTSDSYCVRPDPSNPSVSHYELTESWMHLFKERKTFHKIEGVKIEDKPMPKGQIHKRVLLQTQEGNILVKKVPSQAEATILLDRINRFLQDESIKTAVILDWDREDGGMIWLCAGLTLVFLLMGLALLVAVGHEMRYRERLAKLTYSHSKQ